MSVIYSFFQLISKCRIEIPIIQRDYAQGRVNSKAKDVRKTIVSDLIKAVKGKKALFFDFVYGRLDNYKFIPFDGQQRLTTLFLFHKYVFERCQRISNCEHKDSCICKEILKNFTYATRQSSREFCREMVENDIIPIQRNEKVSNHVINQSWFYSDWEKDPTIMGMLEMFDEIHFQFENTKVDDYRSFAEKLTSGCNCPITFYFVDMGGNKLPDETYVKMNARGKTLTPFENFKASLEQYLHEANEKELVNRLNSNIDGKWLDLFWNVINEGKEENELPDSAIMSFFNRHFMNVWRSYNNKDEEDKIPSYPTKEEFVSWDIYKEILKCNVETCLSPLFNIMDCLFDNQKEIEENCQAVWNRNIVNKWNLFEGERNREKSETYPSRVAFYALMKYFEKSDYSPKTLAQWMRVVWNIIENSTIDSNTTFNAALRLIDDLANGCNDIYQSLADPNFKIESKHAEQQVKEEKTKARRINKGPNEEEKFINAEKELFFKGSIRFLFPDEQQNEEWDIFDKKREKAQLYFNNDGVKEDYKVKLTKALVLSCDKWDQIYNRQIFNPNASTWKQILCSDLWARQVSILLTQDIDMIQETQHMDDANVNRNIKPVLSKLPYEAMINDLPLGRLRWNGRLGYFKPYGRDAFALDWDNFRRKELLADLKDEIRVENKKVGESDYYWGWDITFSFPIGDKKKKFLWGSDNKIYLIEKEPEDINNYIFDVNNIADKGMIIDNLKRLISDAYPNEAC